MPSIDWEVWLSFFLFQMRVKYETKRKLRYPKLQTWKIKRKLIMTMVTLKRMNKWKVIGAKVNLYKKCLITNSWDLCQNGSLFYFSFQSTDVLGLFDWVTLNLFTCASHQVRHQGLLQKYLLREINESLIAIRYLNIQSFKFIYRIIYEHTKKKYLYNWTYLFWTMYLIMLLPDNDKYFLDEIQVWKIFYSTSTIRLILNAVQQSIFYIPCVVFEIV